MFIASTIANITIANAAAASERSNGCWTSTAKEVDVYLRLAAALWEIKRATLSRTQPSPHNGSCPGASAPLSGSISRPRAFSEGPSCAVNQLSWLRFSLPHTAHRSVPDWFGSFVVTIRRAAALTPRELPPEERRFTGHTKKITLPVVLIKDHATRLRFVRCNPA